MAEILKNDALRFLANQATNSVNVVISSPPYFMGKEYDTSSKVEDFLAAHEKLLKELVRVVKPGGSICWQIGHHVQDNVLVPLDALVYAVFSKSEKIKLRNRIVWTFGHGAHCSKRFSGRHETVLWFTKGDRYHFDLDAVRILQKYPGKKHYKGSNRGKPSGNPRGKNPGDVWEIPNVKAGHVEKTEHPCQFPIALAQRLIRALCPARGLVVDPYVGSGSSAIAALLENRRFKGCDLEEKYVDIAKDRVRKLRQGTLRLRPLNQPIYTPRKTDAVAKIPEQWLAHGADFSSGS